jgi:hypothetical protein
MNGTMTLTPRLTTANRVSPGTAITGFPPGAACGATHAADAAVGQARSDLVIAYNDAYTPAGNVCPTRSPLTEAVGALVRTAEKAS